MWQVKFPESPCLIRPTEEVEVHCAWAPAGFLGPVPSMFGFDQVELRHHICWSQVDVQTDDLIQEARLFLLTPRVAPIARTFHERND